jgi:hypothetical protein
MKLRRAFLISLLTALGIGGAAHAYDRWSAPPRGDAGCIMRDGMVAEPMGGAAAHMSSASAT